MRIGKDLERFSEKSKKKKIATFFLNPCFHSVCLYRFSNFFYNIHLPILAKIIWYLNRVIFCVDIDYRANLAGGLVIKHGVGIVIGRYVTSEGNLTIYQGVTIGGNREKTRVYMEKILYQPQIESDVVIYTDAKLFGPIVITRGSTISAGQIVTHDF